MKKMKFLLASILLLAFSVNGENGYTTYTATAYSLRGKMASGRYVHKGAIAADPRVLPLGTKVYIKGLGNYVVLDTGGRIKGRKIDIWMPNRRDAIKFGRKQVELKVITGDN